MVTIPLALAALMVAAAALPAGAAPSAITSLKPLHRETPLTAGGKAQAVILVPDSAAGRQAGQVVAARVREVSGVAPTVTTDAAQADLKTTHVVALGNLLDNPLIERLYWNRYSFADRLTPGAGAYALRSVCNPYPWVSGKNAFLVEASDDAGMLAGARALAGRIAGGADVTLPWTLTLSTFTPPAPAKLAELRRDLKPEILFTDFMGAARNYLRTPNPIFLETVKIVLDGLCGVYEKEPKRHLTWPEETQSEGIMPLWDAIEECDAFTDAERLRYTNLLLAQLRAHPQHIYEFSQLENATSIAWNHTTFPLMGLYWSSRYFRAYYPAVDREQMALFQRKIEACLTGQEKCWKPREDSAGYVVITPRHMMTWALAENRRAYIEKGFPLEFAWHVMATADPMGYTAGHGDHPLAKAPSDELGALPLPYYLTRDGRLLWRLNQIAGGEWANPYWRDVKPVPPSNLDGLYVNPMHPEFYRWSDNLGVYGTPAAPHNVPLERSFDKLTLRSGLAPESQYLLVDGFGRGYHLHYDTNMIVKYTNAGQVLLMDSDYLVRNTTEHNGLSVVRDGRSERLIPALASLDARADLPGCLMARTSVADYNGVDWHRTLLMVKGGPVAVFDEAVARQPADYTFWCVWKTLDEDREKVEGAQTYHVLLPGSERLPTPGFAVVKAPDARGGEALRFDAQRAAVEFEVALPKGRYMMQLRGYGTNGGNDSLHVRLAGRQEPLAFHVPKDAFGEAMGAWDLSAPAPAVEVGKGGRQRFSITLREGPGTVLDTIRILDEAGKPLFDKRAIDLVAPTGERLRIPDHHFYVSGTGGPALQLSPRVNANNEAVKRLRQVVNVRLAAGQGYTYQNVLASVMGAPAAPVLRRLGERAFTARVAGQDYLYGVGDPEKPETYGRLTVAARAFVLGAGKLALMDGRRVALDGKPVFQAAAPTAKEIAWRGPSVEALVRAARPGAPSDPSDRSDRSDRPDGPARQAAAGAAGTAPSAPPTPHSPWSFTPDAPVYREGPEFLECADVDGDGQPEILYGAGSVLYVLNREGKPVWKFACKERVRSCAVADVDGDGKPEVLLGGNDECVHLLDRAGKEIRSWHCDVTLISGQGHGRNPEVTALAAADINGDGKVEILAGTRNCWIIAYTIEGKVLWQQSRQYHGVRRILVADVDGDGKPEVLSANRYGGASFYSGEGKGKGSVVSELGDVSMALGRCIAGALPVVVNGSSTGVLKARTVARDAKELEFTNNGFGVNEVACADMNGDGLDEILVASETGTIYCLDGQGGVVWRFLAGAVVRDLAAADLDGDGRPEVVCAIEDGSTWILSGAGAPLGRSTGASPAMLAATCGAGRGALSLTAGQNGVLSALTAPAR